MEQKKLIQFRNIVKDFDLPYLPRDFSGDIYEMSLITLLDRMAAARRMLLRTSGGFLDANEGATDLDGSGYRQGAGCISGS